MNDVDVAMFDVAWSTLCGLSSHIKGWLVFNPEK
jgi:hypothetical protein